MTNNVFIWTIFCIAALTADAEQQQYTHRSILMRRDNMEVAYGGDNMEEEHRSRQEKIKVVSTPTVYEDDGGDVAHDMADEKVSGDPEKDGIMVIVESRVTSKLEPVIKHFSDHVPSWDVMLVHGTHNADLARQIQGRVPRLQLKNVHRVDSIRGAHGGKEYSRLLTTHSFWLHIPKEHILIFQVDAWICQSSGKTLEQFKEFAMVGSGIASAGCGGLALRRKSWMLKATSLDKFPPNSRGVGEDSVFDDRLVKLGAPLPTQADRDAFATEGTPSGDNRTFRPEDHGASPWGCHLMGCLHYKACGWPFHDMHSILQMEDNSTGDQLQSTDEWYSSLGWTARA